MIIVGILYFVAARVWGGVPRPILQRNVEDLPLNTELRFVNSDDMPTDLDYGARGGVRGTQPGFRI